MHVVQRRQVEMEMLAAGAGLGHAYEASMVTQVETEVVAAAYGSRPASVSGVDVSAVFVFYEAPRKKWSVASGQ